MSRKLKPLCCRLEAWNRSASTNTQTLEPSFDDQQKAQWTGKTPSTSQEQRGVDGKWKLETGTLALRDRLEASARQLLHSDFVCRGMCETHGFRNIASTSHVASEAARTESPEALHPGRLHTGSCTPQRTLDAHAGLKPPERVRERFLAESIENVLQGIGSQKCRLWRSCFL